MMARSAAKRLLPLSVVNNIRAIRNEVFSLSVRARRSFAFHRNRLFCVDKSIFRHALTDIGIRGEDVIFVHSSYDQMSSLRATPLEIIEILCEAVGEAGTLVMPTFPIKDLYKRPFFDVRRTPSRAGLLTEIFRRMPGTVRSFHPTHSVAARGRLAIWLTEGHEKSDTPFDENSPFQKMLDLDALVVRIGDFDRMSFHHLADHLMLEKITYPVYGGPVNVDMIGLDGKRRVLVMRGRNHDVNCDHGVVLDEMSKEDLLITAKVGRIPISCVRVRKYVDAYHRFYEQGLFYHYSASERTNSRLSKNP